MRRPYFKLMRQSMVMETMDKLITMELTKRKVKNIEEKKKKLLNIYCTNINVNNTVMLKRKCIDVSPKSEITHRVLYAVRNF